jgi:carboxylesterase type B
VLLASPLGKGLFQGAIAMSGGSTLNWTLPTLSQAEAAGTRFMNAKGASTLTDLRALSADQIAAAVPNMSYGPIVDGHVLPAQIDAIVSQGKHSDVPILTGVTADEGGASPNPTTTREGFETRAKDRHGEAAAAFLRLYPATSDAEAGLANNDSARDQQRMALYTWAVRHAKTSRSKTFTYFWTHPMPGPDAARYGAFHSSEIVYALNTLAMSDRPFVDADHKIADRMSSYWANFAAQGDPNGPGLPVWPAVTAQDAVTLEIGDATSVIPIAGSPARLAFWRDYYSVPRPPQPPLVTIR